VKFPRIHGILSPFYFQGAIARAKELNPLIDQLIVFSDDLPWCNTQEFLKGALFVDEPNDVFALWLMSQFRNYVMSNSSFSWWAVMLNTQRHTVVAPDMWFGPDGPQDYQDIYEPTWFKHRVILQ
jgi:hypothetical protein